MSTLASEHCEACEKGTPPLPEDEAAKLAEDVPEWQRDGNQKLHREFSFPNFRDAFGFVARVVLVAESEGHSPDIELGWGRGELRPHDPAASGLTRNDFVMAAKIDRLSQQEASVSLEAEMLAHIKAGVEHHNATCPMPARAILLNAGNFELFGWDEIFGLPVEPRDDIPPKRFRVDCPGSAYGIEEEIAEAARRAARRAGAGVAGAPRGRHDSVLGFGQPALALQLLEMRLEREHRRRAQVGGRVVPHDVQQLVTRCAAHVPARPAGGARGRGGGRCTHRASRLPIPHHRAVAGTQRLDVIERAAAV